MRFGRTFSILFSLVIALTVALVLTHRFRPVQPLISGDPLFPIQPETITAITWDVTNELGHLQQLRIERKGLFWQMVTPYTGFRCDTAEVVRLLDTIQALKVVTPLNNVDATTIPKGPQLVVETPEKQLVCTFGEIPPMNVAQMTAQCNNIFVAVNTSTVKQLPVSARQLWSRAILPVSTTNLTSIEWRAPRLPFTKVFKRDTGKWSVSQPFAFEPNEAKAEQALSLLTNAAIITDYLRPLPDDVASTIFPETALIPYGLDEDSAIRVTIRAKGFSDPFQLRFGAKDPNNPTQVYCLLDNRQAIVSIPEKVRDLFTQAGPFVTTHLNLPFLGDATNPTAITIHKTTEIKQRTVLNLRNNQWELTTPAAFPANPVAVKQLLQQLTTLPGDLTESLTPDETRFICTINFTFETPKQPIEVKFYQESDTKLLARRMDTNRLYSFNKDNFPKALLELNTLNQKLLNRTLFALPESTIKRVTVEKNGVLQCTVVRNTETQQWNTAFPQKFYIQDETLTKWLNLFTDFTAEAVLSDAVLGKTQLSAYGFDQPQLKITLDLDGSDEGLRKVLIIASDANETDGTPVMVQGRPLLYLISSGTLQLLKRPLVAAENAHANTAQP